MGDGGGADCDFGGYLVLIGILAATDLRVLEDVGAVPGCGDDGGGVGGHYSELAVDLAGRN